MTSLYWTIISVIYNKTVCTVCPFQYNEPLSEKWTRRNGHTVLDISQLYKVSFIKT